MALTTKPYWDKYDGYIGNHRGVLAANINLETQANKVLATGKNAQGAIVIGGGQTGIKGLMIVAVGQNVSGTGLLDGGINNQAGDPQDVGSHGEIVNFRPFDAANPASVIAPAAGTNYYGHPNGSVLATKVDGCVYVGHTAEADRLIVDVSNIPAVHDEP